MQGVQLKQLITDCLSLNYVGINILLWLQTQITNYIAVSSHPLNMEHHVVVTILSNFFPCYHPIFLISNDLIISRFPLLHAIVCKISKSRLQNYGFALFNRIKLLEKCLSFANVLFTTVLLRTNVKPSLWNVAVFISTEQNGSYVIRKNNIKQKNVVRLLFPHTTKETFRTT